MSTSSLGTPIAVVGMSCRLPGADGLDEFWSLLAEGRDAVVEMPPHRLDRDLYYDGRRGARGKTYSTIGGLVPERAARSGDESHDLCHRIFADVALDACRDAGWDTDRMVSRNVGIFVGHSGGSPEFFDVIVGTLAAQAVEPLAEVEGLRAMSPERRKVVLERLVERIREGRPRRLPGGDPKAEARWAAELLAQILGTDGPNYVLDAACSSSLVALAMGALALGRGDIDAAIVGGASFAQTNSLILFSQAQSCSARGSRPFDSGADGLVGSEGYVALVLKTEERARRDDDRILAVIRGIGLSTDGRGRHLWAPRREGQEAAMRRAWGKHLDPASVQYVEAHATSTQVGDATEIESMSDFFGRHLNGRKIPVGSVKSNLGHTLETAGLASVVKVVLAMRRGAIPPTIHIESPNDAIDWSAVPFEVNRVLRPWSRPEGDVRRGAVSAFGIGGLNVHLVLEEPRDAEEEKREETPVTRTPIAIVGRGVVVPGAHDVPALRALLSGGPPALSAAPSSRWPGGVGVAPPGTPWAAPTSHGGFLTDYEVDAVAFRIPPNQIASANPLQFFLLDATAQALEEAGPVERAETAVVVGTQFGGDFGNQLHLGMRFPEIRRALVATLCEAGLSTDESETIASEYEERFFATYPALLDETGSFTSSTLASRVTKAFDLEGGAMAIDAGSPSGLVAVGTACSMLRGGVCSSVVCAGAYRAMDLPSFEAMAAKGYFDDPGYHPGEGVGVLVLKRLEDARRDGNRIFGLLLGEGTAYRNRDVEAASEGASRRALNHAGFEDRQVQRLALGGGHAEVRHAQNLALGRVYPARAARPALADLTGHLGPAQDVVSLIASTVDGPIGLEAHHASGETGLASHVVLGPPPPVRTGRGSRFRLRIGAPTLPVLRERLIYAGGGEHAPFSAEDRYRLALISPDPAEMPLRLGMAEAAFDTLRTASLEDQGIYFGVVPKQRSRVAFVFSGQGSQYAGMLKELVEHSPAARRTLEEADEALRAAGLGTFAEMAWGDRPRLDEDPVTTQLSVLVADSMVYAAVTELGLEPDCVCGHSFGEIAAMVGAKVLTLEQAIRVTLERARALGAADPEGGLVSLQATAQEVRATLASLGCELYVTHVNGPQQTVVGGRRADLAEVVRVFEAIGVRCTSLKVPGALHSPLVAAAQDPLREALERETLRPPTRLFYSNVTCGQVSRPEEFVANLVAQLVEPLDYPKLIRRLVEDGVGALVEVGPGQVLTRLHRRIVDPGMVCTGTDHPRRAAGEQLERAWTALECVGAVSGGTPLAAPAAVPAGRLMEFDATTGRRQRRRSEAAAAPGPELPPEPLTSDETDPATVALLLDFVVDLTGYPRNAVSLDWDLEADLGLDSIKRTHLVGELAEALSIDVDATAGATIADLHTLRDLLGFLRAVQTTRPGEDGPPGDEAARARGFAEGQRHGAFIRETLREEALREDATSPPESASEAMGRLAPEELAELRGMADAAECHVGNLIAFRLRHGAAPRPDESRKADPIPSARPPRSDGAPPGPVCSRYVLRTVSLPHPAGGVGRTLEGGAIVVGSTPLAERLHRRLESLGVAVHVVDPAEGPEAAAESVRRAWDRGPLRHLFIAAGSTGSTLKDLDSTLWRDRRPQVLMVPFRAIQQWIGLVKEAGLMNEASLVAFTELGGDFGISGRLESFETGALTGLVKAVVIENWVAGYRHLAAKVIDTPAGMDPEEVAELGLAELAHPSYEAEIGIVDGQRHVVRPAHQKLPELRSGLDLGRQWIFTGGARGITAHVAAELARRFGLRLHLLGRAPAPQLRPDWAALWRDRRPELKVRVMEGARAEGRNAVQAWEDAQKAFEIQDSLENLEALGVTATYHSCDVADLEQLHRVLAEIRKEGPIDGILHGAGASRDAKFEHKEPKRVDECFRAKVDGTLALMEATRTDPLRYFVAFGSVSGRFGANGHADYSSANDMLAKQVDWYRRQRPEVAAVAIHWHAWGNVGMAVKAQTQLGLQLADIRFMPAEEGIDHLVRELAAGAPEGEVVITEERYCARYVPADARPDANPPTESAPTPLFVEAPERRGGGTEVHSCILDPDQEVFLRDHLLDGRPILPMVVALELASEAALGVQRGPFALRRVEIVNGLRFHGPSAQTAKVYVTPEGGDAKICLVAADFSARDGTLLERDRPVVRAVVDALGPGWSEPQTSNGAVPKGPWQPVEYNAADSRIRHGPALQALRSVCLRDDGLWGTVSATSIAHFAGPERPSGGWRIHGPALDACLFAVGYLAWALKPGPTIPAGVDRLLVGRFPHPREDCFVHVRPNPAGEPGEKFDFSLYGSDGAVLMEAVGYRVARLAPSPETTR